MPLGAKKGVGQWVKSFAQWLARLWEQDLLSTEYLFEHFRRIGSDYQEWKTIKNRILQNSLSAVNIFLKIFAIDIFYILTRP